MLSLYDDKGFNSYQMWLCQIIQQPLTTLIRGYNANDIVIDVDCFVSLQEIHNVAYKKTKEL